VYFVKSVHESEKIKGVLRLDLDTFADHRGEIWTTYTEVDFLPSFVEDKVSISGKNVLRGLHGDSEIAKLITCMQGEMQLVILDLRQASPTYGALQMYDLSDQNPLSIYVPAGCVNGHLCLSARGLFFYKWSKIYNGADKQVTIQWNDPNLDIPWKCSDPVVSDRDRIHGVIAEGVYL